MGRSLPLLGALACLVLASCGKDDAASKAAKERTLLVGYTASLTGKLSVESTRQTRGLSLWVERVNAAGGIKLPDGRTLQVASKFYDDESNQDRVQELYTRLVNDDKADFLVSPYSSGLTSSASVIAEQYGKVMISAGAASDSNYEQGFQHVFQVYTPASRYLVGALDLIAATAPDAKKIAIVHENDKFSADVAKALDANARAKGFTVVLDEGYDSSTTDFAPFINKVQQSGADAILGGGHFQDGSTFARQLAEKGVKARFLVLLVAPPEPGFGELGNAALGVLGPSQWEPQVSFTAEGAKSAGLAWFGLTGTEFVEAYKAAHKEEPSYHAAGGYIAGLLLEEAIARAGSVDGEAVRKALAATDLLTFFGRSKFFAPDAAHGLQIGHEMVLVQWQKGPDGKLLKQVVWPPQGRTAEPILR
ncbi:MAG: amino acid ABC transporter substrate-binding protein [Planctomycetota bacterium]